jgi:hypothetical protein
MPPTSFQRPIAPLGCLVIRQKFTVKGHSIFNLLHSAFEELSGLEWGMDVTSENFCAMWECQVSNKVVIFGSFVTQF